MTPDALWSRQSAGARPIIFVAVGAALILDGLSGAEVNGILRSGHGALAQRPFWATPLPTLVCQMSC
jgi:hypothetical protein